MTNEANSSTHLGDIQLGVEESTDNGSDNTREIQIEKLKILCNDNAEYFARDSTESGQRMYISFLSMVDTVEQLRPIITTIEGRVKEFDFDEKTLGNGYRSFLHIIDSAIKLAISLAEKVILKSESMFRKYSLTK